jgi:hypothetical protein
MAHSSASERSTLPFVTVQREIRHGWPKGLLLGLLPLLVWAAATWVSQASQITGIAHTPNDGAALLGWSALALAGVGLVGALLLVRQERWRSLALGALGGLGVSVVSGVVLTILWPFL